MKQFTVLLFLINIYTAGYSKSSETNNFNKLQININAFINIKTFEERNKIVGNECKLVEEQHNGVTEILYDYDTFNRLIEKRYVRLKFSEFYTYDENGYLIEVNNTSPNAFRIEFIYNNGVLVLKSKKYRSLSSAIVWTYEYKNTNEIVKITESYLSNITTTEFKNREVIKITNPFIKYDLNSKGLVMKSSSISELSTFNKYQYDNNDMLILNEVYSGPNSKTMYNEYESSKIKKSNKGDEFIDTYKGFPIYKNPFGEQPFYIKRITNYRSNMNTGQMEKIYEKSIIHTEDINGKIMNETPSIDTEKTIVYIYARCNN